MFLAPIFAPKNHPKKAPAGWEKLHLLVQVRGASFWPVCDPHFGGHGGPCPFVFLFRVPAGGGHFLTPILDQKSFKKWGRASPPDPVLGPVSEASISKLFRMSRLQHSSHGSIMLAPLGRWLELQFGSTWTSRQYLEFIATLVVHAVGAVSGRTCQTVE